MMMNKINGKAVILLSGGLDSAVSLAYAVNNGIDVVQALFFDYGQKAFEKEYKSAVNLSKYYNIKLKCIKLDWLKKITNTSLVSDKNVPELNKTDLDDIHITSDSMKNVWVPNRNALFINIAAAYADSYELDYIIIGANSEEAATFSDNSIEFIDAMNNVLKTSTTYHPQMYAPLINMNKNGIVNKAIELNVPLEYINSCYNNSKKHCGKCESCNRLLKALEETGHRELIRKLF